MWDVMNGLCRYRENSVILLGDLNDKVSFLNDFFLERGVDSFYKKGDFEKDVFVEEEIIKDFLVGGYILNGKAVRGNYVNLNKMCFDSSEGSNRAMLGYLDTIFDKSGLNGLNSFVENYSSNLPEKEIFERVSDYVMKKNSKGGSSRTFGVPVGEILEKRLF